MIHTIQDFHRGAFTGAIFAQQGMDFSRTHIKIDTVIGKHPGKSLSDIAHFQEIYSSLAGREFISRFHNISTGSDLRNAQAWLPKRSTLVMDTHTNTGVSHVSGGRLAESFCDGRRYRPCGYRRPYQAAVLIDFRPPGKVGTDRSSGKAPDRYWGGQRNRTVTYSGGSNCWDLPYLPTVGAGSRFPYRWLQHPQQCILNHPED